MKKLPPLARKILVNGNAWVVGSSVLAGEPTKDLDILVPIENWHLVAALIPENAKPNTFGGWKFVDQDIEIDVWPDNITSLLGREKFKAAYHFNSGYFLKKD